jgi:hypothetical protein
MSSIYIQLVKTRLRRMIKLETDPVKEKDLVDMLKLLDRHLATEKQWREAAKMIGVRNPAFDGDYIGYPDDDF